MDNDKPTAKANLQKLAPEQDKATTGYILNTIENLLGRQKEAGPSFDINKEYKKIRMEEEKILKNSDLKTKKHDKRDPLTPDGKGHGK